MISPATCCLINPDKVLTVEKAFGAVQALAQQFRKTYDPGRA
jgi:hypothetical protein